MSPELARGQPMGHNGAWDRLADRILDHSLELRAGENLLVALNSPDVYPLAQALADGAIRRNAHHHALLHTDATDEAIRRFGSDEQARHELSLELAAMSWADAHVALRGMVPPTGAIEDDAARRRAALLRGAHGEVSAARWAETRWCVVRIPTPAYADYLGRAADSLLDDFLQGSVDDDGWADLAGIEEALDGSEDVRIVADDTDLQFSVAGRTWVLFDGKRNLPDGEVATAPVESTVRGTIGFPSPIVFAGQRIEGLRLEFTDGRVTGVDAGPNTHFVETILATDDGAARVGEFGIGLNRHISGWTQDLFFDEKIVGTTHIALGRAYPECGGTNRSAIHWDIVKDLRATGARKAGTVYVDGEAVVEGSKVTVPGSRRG